MVASNQPAALQIKAFVIQMIRDADPGIAPSVFDDAARPKPLELKLRINVLYVDDVLEQDLSSLDAEGRSLELDFRIEINQYKHSEDSAKTISGFIEGVLMQNNGVMQMLGAEVRAERAGDSEPQVSNEGEYDTVMMETAYSFIYRVKRGEPNVLV